MLASHPGLRLDPKMCLIYVKSTLINNGKQYIFPSNLTHVPLDFFKWSYYFTLNNSKIQRRKFPNPHTIPSSPSAKHISRNSACWEYMRHIFFYFS